MWALLIVAAVGAAGVAALARRRTRRRRRRSQRDEADREAVRQLLGLGPEDVVILPGEAAPGVPGLPLEVTGLVLRIQQIRDWPERGARFPGYPSAAEYDSAIRAARDAGYLAVAEWIERVRAEG